MNSKQNRRWLLTTLLAVSSATFLATGVRAQQVVGSFTLPYTVQWGLATLPPGDYTISTHVVLDSAVISVHRPGSTVMIMARGRSTLTGNRNLLHISKLGNEATVSSLDLAASRVTFQYNTHPRRQIREEASNPHQIGTAVASAVDIPIMVNGQ